MLIESLEKERNAPRVLPGPWRVAVAVCGRGLASEAGPSCRLRR